MTNRDPELSDLDPNHVHIHKKKFAELLAMSVPELDRRRREDPGCPKGFKEKDTKLSKVKFVLADCYQYADTILERGFKI